MSEDVEKLAKEIFNNLQENIKEYQNPFDLINLTVNPKKSIRLIADALKDSYNQGVEDAAVMVEQMIRDRKIP